MVGETIMMNATTSGLMGITNLSSQTGSLGTVFGAAILIGLIMGIGASLHSWNSKGWLFKLVKWLMNNVGENVLYGTLTSGVIGGVYLGGKTLSEFGEANPKFLYDMAFLFGEGIAIVAGLAIIGYISKPAWNFAYDYMFCQDKKKVKT